MKRLVATALTILILDQASKQWVTNALDEYESMVVLPGFMNFNLSRNTGMAFGILNNLDFEYKRELVTVLSLGALLVVAYYFLQSKEQHWLTIQSLGLVTGGALGNILDRIRLGYVIDFIDVYYRDYHWHTFNVADSAISVGVALLVLHSLIPQRSVEEASPGHNPR